MTSRDRNVLLAVGGLLLVAAFWFLALSPRRQELKKLDDRSVAAQTRLSAAQQSAAQATRARAGYAADYATVARLGKAVPADDDVPSLLFQLQDASHRAKVDFRAIKLDSSGASAAPATTTSAQQVAALGAAQKGTGAPAASGAAAPAAGAGATTTPTSSTPATPATPASGAAATSGTATAAATQSSAAGLPPGASVGSAGLSTMPFAFTFTGSFFRLEDLFGRLSRFTQVDGRRITVRGRLLSVEGFALSASTKGFPDMQAQVKVTSFLQPPDVAAAPVAPAAAASTAVPASGSAPATPAPAAVVVAGGRK